jgi:hypothetical protein
MGAEGQWGRKGHNTHKLTTERILNVNDISKEHSHKDELDRSVAPEPPDISSFTHWLHDLGHWVRL